MSQNFATMQSTYTKLVDESVYQMALSLKRLSNEGLDISHKVLS